VRPSTNRRSACWRPEASSNWPPIFVLLRLTSGRDPEPTAASRSGNVWDNAAMESFFLSLKTERAARKTYRSRDQARADVFDYIECFYNPARRHSKLGYVSPIEFEKLAKSA